MPHVALRTWLLASLAALALALPARADEPALAGTVASAADGAMEGVLVTARADGSTMAVTVVSDRQGHYSFPADRLAPGHYALTIRAVGYELPGAPTVDVAAGKTASADLTLGATKNLASQLTAAEWMMSVPGTEDQKRTLIDCTGCHTVERVLRSTHDADEFAQVMWRMAGYAFVSQPIKPQRRVNQSGAGMPDRYRTPAAYLATINLSKDETWSYPLKTLPRPTGRGTRVVITQYDLPRPTIEPHDVIVGQDGMVWYSNFGEQFLGRIDPKTGAHKEWALPVLKPEQPVGTLDLREDANGNLWIAMMHQAALAKFDPKTEQFRIYPVPAEYNDDVAQIAMLTPPKKGAHALWALNQGNMDVYRVDTDTGAMTRFQPLKQLAGPGPKVIYGFAADADDNVWFTEFLSHFIGHMDGKTGAVTYYQTPSLHTWPRRIELDAQGRVWIAEFHGNALAMFDPAIQKMTEYPMPTPWDSPYDAVADRNGEVWTGGMSTDRVTRLDPKTGQAVTYLMPRDTNIRRVFVDNSTNPVTFWVGSNHGASILRVEPMD
jgi:virginiamycin B lyase